MTTIDLGRPLVINVAMTGMVSTPEQNASLPVTPDQVAADVRRCFDAGARVFHLHARDEAGDPTPSRAVFASLVERVRQTTPEAIICLTTSGRMHRTFEQRSQALSVDASLRPDLASLTLGSMNFPRQASINEPAMIRRLAEAMRTRGIVPELEVFDFGMVDYAHYLIRKGVLAPPYVFNILLGSLGMLSATAANLALIVDRLPADSFWAAAGIGRFQHAMNALGVAMGGHVRTGLEDNLWMDAARREPATNEALVRRVADQARALGRPLASPAEARALMGLA